MVAFNVWGNYFSWKVNVTDIPDSKDLGGAAMVKDQSNHKLYP